METLVRAIGALAGVMALLGVGVLYSMLKNPGPKLPRGLHMPALALEFVESPQDVKNILGTRGEEDGQRANLRKGLRGDYFFIVMYWLLFAGLSYLLAQRDFKWALWAGLAAFLCATGAAIFDVLENLRLAALLDATEVGPSMLNGIAFACKGKWVLFALTTLLLSLLFVRRDWLAALAVLYAAVALLCLCGVLLRKPHFVEWSFLLTFVGLSALAVVFLARAPQVVKGL